MMPGIVISNTSTVLISIHAVSAPLIGEGLAACALAVAVGWLTWATTGGSAGAAAGTGVVDAAVATGASPAGVCASAAVACSHTVAATKAAAAPRIHARIPIPRSQSHHVRRPAF